MTAVLDAGDTVTVVVPSDGAFETAEEAVVRGRVVGWAPRHTTCRCATAGQ